MNRTAGPFILQMKKHLLSYHKMFLFPSKNLFGKTMRNGAWSEVGPGRDGMSRDHWDESFL